MPLYVPLFWVQVTSWFTLARGVNSERNFARWTQGLCHFGVRVLLGVLSALADSWGRLMTRFERSEASN